MKKVMATLTMAIMVLGVTFCMAGGVSYRPLNRSITNSSFLVLPDVSPNDTNEWIASTAYVAGDYVRQYTNNHYRYFWALTAGTSSNTVPTWNTTNDVTDWTNGLTWRYVHPVRNKFELRNLGAVSNYAGFGQAAVVGKGLVLLPNAANAVVSDFQGEVYVITPSDTNTITIHEE